MAAVADATLLPHLPLPSANFHTFRTSSTLMLSISHLGGEPRLQYGLSIFGFSAASCAVYGLGRADQIYSNGPLLVVFPFFPCHEHMYLLLARVR